MASFDAYAHYHGHKKVHYNKQWLRQQTKSEGAHEELNRIEAHNSINHNNVDKNKHMHKINHGTNANSIKRKFDSSNVGPCFSCGQMGHFKRDCLIRNKTQKISENLQNWGQK